MKTSLNCLFCMCEHILYLTHAVPFKVSLFRTHPVNAVTLPLLEIFSYDGDFKIPT